MKIKNKLFFLVIIAIIMSFVNMNSVRALPTCNIGTVTRVEGQAPQFHEEGYGYMYHDTGSWESTTSTDGQVIICVRSDCTPNVLLGYGLDGYKKWKSESRNFFVEYRVGQGRVNSVKYTLFDEDENGKEFAVCEAGNDLDISKNNGTVTMHFNINAGRVKKIVASGTYTNYNGKKKNFAEKSFNIKRDYKDGEKAVINTTIPSGKTTTKQASLGESSMFGDNGTAYENDPNYITTAPTAANKFETGTVQPGIITNSEKITCENSASLVDLINSYWGIIMIVAPVGLILLVVLDFVKAITSDNADALKKAGSSAIKRTVAVVILVFLPLILSILLSWFGIDFCL